MNMQKRKVNRAGVSSVEFAFVFPLFLLMFFGMIEMARGNMMRNAAKSAAFEAARRAILPGATIEASTHQAERKLSAAGIQEAAIVFTPSTITPSTEQVTVVVEVPVARNSWVIPKFLGATISQKCTLTCEPSSSGY